MLDTQFEPHIRLSWDLEHCPGPKCCPGPRRFQVELSDSRQKRKWKWKVDLQLYATYCLKLDCKWKSLAIRDLPTDIGDREAGLWLGSLLKSEFEPRECRKHFLEFCAFGKYTPQVLKQIDISEYSHQWCVLPWCLRKLVGTGSKGLHFKPALRIAWLRSCMMPSPLSTAWRRRDTNDD